MDEDARPPTDIYRELYVEGRFVGMVWVHLVDVNVEHPWKRWKPPTKVRWWRREVAIGPNPGAVYYRDDLLMGDDTDAASVLAPLRDNELRLEFDASLTGFSAATVREPSVSLDRASEWFADTSQA